MYDIVIIGAGPSGISSAIYSATRGAKTLVLEQDMVGGTIAKVSTVTHYAGVLSEETGKSFATRLKEQVKISGAEILKEKVINVDLHGDIKKVYTQNNTYECKVIIIATGTTQRTLGIEGEQKFAKKGSMLNAMYDGHNYKGKEVFVVGGSDGAVKEALYLSTIAKKVTIIHFEDKLSAIKEFTQKLENTDNIEVMLHSRLTKILGNDKANEIVITDEHDATQTIIKSEGLGVFVYAGATPNSKMFDIKTDDNGYIITNDVQKTSIEGVFAVGDVCKKQVRQISTAVSDGTIAGINAVMYINSK